jgi:hypothetical protein
VCFFTHLGYPQTLITAGDHIFGLLPLLAGVLNGAGGAADDAEDPREHIDVNNPVRIHTKTDSE